MPPNIRGILTGSHVDTTTWARGAQRLQKIGTYSRLPSENPSLRLHSWCRDDLQSAGVLLRVLFAPRTLPHATPHTHTHTLFPPYSKAGIMKQGFRQLTLISCYLKDDKTRSVLINWSGHQTKQTQKAEPDTVIDEQIYYIRLQREPRSKHITRRVRPETHDVTAAACAEHKHRATKAQLLMCVCIITICTIAAASVLNACVNF